MNLRRFAATLATATLTLAVLPATQAVAHTVGDLAHDTAHDTVHESAADEHAHSEHSTGERVLPDETTHPALLKRRTDTASLYRQAGLRPPAKYRTAAATTHADTDASTSTKTTSVSAAANTNDSGQVLPPGIRDHVDQSCTGNGTDGARVQVMYVRETDQKDRYAQVAPILRNEARYIDDAFAVSSAQTGGGKRVRWVTDGSCSINVLNVVLPDGSITGAHGKTENALNAAGYLKANRKYLAFADVAVGGLSGGACGQGTMYLDSKPTDNLNDGRYPQLARVDLECWVTDEQYNAAPLHELIHTLGALQHDSPNGGQGSHCDDGAEVMCYNDGYSNVQAVCPETQKFDIDCNNDDYFNTNPPAGSYLASHWNIANSPFLDTVAALPEAPAITITPSTVTPADGEEVTFTANVPSGTTVTWSTSFPACENTGAPDTGTTFRIRCYAEGPVTVSAVASNSGITTRTAETTVNYGPSAPHRLVVTAPTSAAAGTAFPVSATVENPKGTWTYEWHLRSSACTSSNGLRNPTANITCTSAAAGQVVGVTVAATRASDGAVETNTVGVQINGAGAPTVTITGPDSVTAGQAATFTATVANASNPTYEWTSLQGWHTSSRTGTTFTVQPPSTATASDTVYLTVTSGTKTATAQVAYSVERGIGLTITGPSRIDPGTTGVFTATPSKAATLSWQDDQGLCSLDQDETDQSTARLTCDAFFTGAVTLTVTASSGDETVTRTKKVAVDTASNEPVLTRTTFTASTGYPTTFTATVTDIDTGKAVPGTTVVLERRGLSGSTYTAVKTLETGSTGTVRFQMGINDPAFYRFQYNGDSLHQGSVSSERQVTVGTKMAQGKTRRGLSMKLSTLGGKALGSKPVVLEKRVAGQGRWVRVKGYRTSSNGTVTISVNPNRATDYRWKFAGGSGYRNSTSKVVRLT